MVLLRRVIGDALRARRQGQQRTLREVSSAANVSLGYLSEIERGQKEPSSELLAAICDALGARLSELLREVSDTVALAEQMPGVLVPVQGEPAQPAEAAPVARAAVAKSANRGVRQVTSGGPVAMTVRQDSPLKATLRSKRVRPAERDVVCAA
ncbi:helix-turn-helix domain-containing protein [Micromonospora olivasterospora]|uniref:Helix-turn-helix protein n=1 Tax=Micromonospora olivasterospora TaxID=1880 RepID=A0A562IDA1_MICOL|nr:helix-turn-helix transcriptional regulator [Micromonospora olivasterospora]TWH68950.1 helix-turn-helix protein [Micromonospora olivasterospora]